MAKMVLRHRFDVAVWVVERLKNIAAPDAWLLFLIHAAFAPCGSSTMCFNKIREYPHNSISQEIDNTGH